MENESKRIIPVEPQVPDTLSKLSHWFPVASHVLRPSQYPRTMLVSTELELASYVDGATTGEMVALNALADEIDRHVSVVGGYPVFLRSDLFSAKHAYTTTTKEPPCYVRSKEQIAASLIQIADEAEGVMFPFAEGLHVWAVREWITGNHDLRAFGGLRIGSEVRARVNPSGLHGLPVYEEFFYWPTDAIANPVDLDNKTPLTEGDTVMRMAYLRSVDTRKSREGRRSDSLRVVEMLGGGMWSVDWMWNWDGWKLIDMAIGERSWWPDVEFSPPGLFQKPEPVDPESLLESVTP